MLAQDSPERLHEPPETPQRGSVAWTLLGSVLLVVLVLVAYRQAPLNSFHFDDHPSITLHAPVQIEQLSIPALRGAFLHPAIARRHLASLTFAIDWWRGKGTARPFLLTNVWIHVASSLAVFYLLHLVCAYRDRTPPRLLATVSFLGAAAWALHPIQSQTVTYVVQRMASLANVFVVLSVVFFLEGRRRIGKVRVLAFTLCLFTTLLGVLSKETAWVTPLLLVLAELGVQRNQKSSLFRSLREKALLSSPFVAAFALATTVVAGIGPLGSYAMGFERRDFTLAERLLTQPRVILFHLGQILWPHPDRFNLDHDFEISTSLISPPTTLIAMVVLLSLTALGLRFLSQRGKRTLGFLMLWIPITLALESSIFALEMVFEHRMLLPSVGLAALLALGLLRVLKSLGTRMQAITVAASTLVLVLLAQSTFLRVQVWRSDVSLWSDVVRKSPQKARPHNNLGEALWSQGDTQGALTQYESAVDLDPDYPEAHANLARVLQANGKTYLAIEHFERALELASGYAGAYYSLGLLYLDIGNWKEASSSFEKAILFEPNHPQARLFLRFAQDRVRAGS